MDWKLFLTTFGTIFVAELGDKTQLACVLTAADSRNPWIVFVGSSLALITTSLLGVLFAEFICNYVSPEIIKKVAAVAFVIMGALIYFDKL